MWGICLDSKAFEAGLFQAVVQYKIDNDKALVMLPEVHFELDIKRIRELPTPPRFIYGEQVSLCSHPDTVGVIVENKKQTIL